MPGQRLLEVGDRRVLRLHVHVIAVRLPSPRAEGDRVDAELLPWADPYITALIRRLAQQEGGDPAADEPLTSLAADVWDPPADDVWDPLAEDAFAPPPEEPLTVLRPILGGYPLLDVPPPADHGASAGCSPTPHDPVRRPR